jgi:thiamine kinase-like enzyme
MLVLCLIPLLIFIYTRFKPIPKNFPYKFSDIKPIFIEKILKKNNIISQNTQVIDTMVDLLQGGVHYNVGRVFLTYAEGSASDPQSVIIKMIHDKNGTSVLNKIKIYIKKKYPWLPFLYNTGEFIEKLKSYEVELKFYRDFACEIPIPTPKSYFNYEDYFNFYFLIVLEDLGGYDVGKPDGFSNEASFEIVKNISKLHARFWEKPYFENNHSNLLLSSGGYWFGDKEMDHSKSINICWEKTLENFGSFLDPEIVQQANDLLIPKIQENMDIITKYVHNFPFKTLIHGDYKITNLFYSNNNKIVYTIDWQWLGTGCGATDISYFLYTSLPIFNSNNYISSVEMDTSIREKYDYYSTIELDLMYEYWKNLIENGVDQEQYTFELFEQQYILNVIFFLIFCIREKYMYMTKNDITKNKYTDGLHLRSFPHIQQLISRSCQLMQKLDFSFLKSHVVYDV